MQLSFVLEGCLFRLSACREDRRLVMARQMERLLVGEESKRRRTGGQRRFGVPHQKGGHSNQPYGTTDRIRGGEGFAGLRHRGASKVLDNLSCCTRQPQRSTCGRTRGARGRGGGSTPSASTDEPRLLAAF